MTVSLEYLTIAEVRGEFGTEISGDTDAAIQRRIDDMAAYLEDQLGHTFGRALIARSTGADTVQVTATALIINGTSYLFATYPTLFELANAVNDAGASYEVELLPLVRTDTPSVLLKVRAAVPCGPDYDDRVILSASAMYCLLSGKYESHLFLPLPLAQVNTVVEDLITLTSADYWAMTGDPWVIRKACSCTNGCTHMRGRWSAAYPGNIGLTFVPTFWGRVPSSLKGLLLDAYSAKGGLEPFSAESFGDYSYKRKTAVVADWTDILGSGSVRRYAVRFQP